MSVLDEMTAATRSRKEDKAATLTPVGVERGGPLATSRIPDVPEVFLTAEAITDIAKDLRRQAQMLLDVADGLDNHVGRTSVAPIDTSEKIAEAVKAQEREADESFAERFEVLKAEAQAAAFAAGDAPAAEPIVAASGSPVDGWTCPVHGDANLSELTSRKGRKYRACQTCNQFEK